MELCAVMWLASWETTHFSAARATLPRTTRASYWNATPTPSAGLTSPCTRTPRVLRNCTPSTGRFRRDWRSRSCHPMIAGAKSVSKSTTTCAPEFRTPKEDRMRRLPVTALAVALLCAVALAAAADDKKPKVKPKNAPTLDDRTATLTETVDGQKKESKIDLKYSLKVDGYFDD